MDQRSAIGPCRLHKMPLPAERAISHTKLSILNTILMAKTCALSQDRGPRLGHNEPKKLAGNNQLNLKGKQCKHEAPHLS